MDWFGNFWSWLKIKICWSPILMTASSMVLFFYVKQQIFIMLELAPVKSGCGCQILVVCMYKPFPNQNDYFSPSIMPVKSIPSVIFYQTMATAIRQAVRYRTFFAGIAIFWPNLSCAGQSHARAARKLGPKECRNGAGVSVGQCNAKGEGNLMVFVFEDGF